MEPNHVLLRLAYFASWRILVTVILRLFFSTTKQNKNTKQTRKQNTNKTKTLQLITKGKALNGEKEFPLLLKFPFAIRRGSNIFFYLDFILH